MARGVGEAHSMGFQVPVLFRPWKWLLLLAALTCSEATSDFNKPTSPSAQREPGIRFAAASSEVDERITVFALDYDYVQIPYEVTLWILLASLAKIGKSKPRVGQVVFHMRYCL